MQGTTLLSTRQDILAHLYVAIGSIMDSSWIRSMAVEVGDLCTAQGQSSV